MKKSKPSGRLSHCMLTAMFLLLCSFSSHAQSLPTDAFVSMRPSGTPAMVTGRYFVEVANSTDVSQIEIKLGISWSGTEYVSQVLDFDVATGLPAGFSYSRSGNLITIDIGDYAENAAYYGEVRVKNSAGSWSGIYQFVSN